MTGESFGGRPEGATIREIDSITGGPADVWFVAGALNSPLWRKTTVDVLGRTITEERPGYNGSTVTTTYEYVAAGSPGAGQVAKTTTTGQAPCAVKGAVLQRVKVPPGKLACSTR